ncbi:hypothetical protein D3C71_1569500 [compost metagenome]
MAEQHAPPRQRHAARGFDVFLAAFHQRRAARRPGEIRPLHDDQRNDHLIHTLAQNRQQHQRDENGGERQLDIHNPHQQRIDAAAEIGGDQPHGGADAKGRQHRHGRHQQAGAHAVEDGREQVARLPVRAQQIAHGTVAAFAARLELGIHDVQRRQVIGILRRDPRRQQRGAHNHDQHHQAQRGQLAGEEIRHETPPGRLFLDGRGRRGSGGGAVHRRLSKRTRGSSTV